MTVPNLYFVCGKRHFCMIRVHSLYVTPSVYICNVVFRASDVDSDSRTKLGLDVTTWRP